MGNFTGVIINKANGGLVRDTDTSDRVILTIPAKSSACLRNVHCILCWFRSLKRCQAC